MKVVIVGGGTAGTETAVQLRKLDSNAEIIILEKTQHFQYSPCALPYVIGGEIATFNDIEITNNEFYNQRNLRLEQGCTVSSIDKQQKKVFYEKDGSKQEMNYDKLVISTGSTPFVPPIKGLESVKYSTFKSLDDAKKLKQIIGAGKKAVIVGGGYIGIELACALKKNNMDVTIVEIKRLVCNALDLEMSDMVQAHLERMGIKIITGISIDKIEANTIYTKEELRYDTLIISCGVHANIDLAQKAGLACDTGILVNEYLETSDPSIYACGDCVQSKYHIHNIPIMSQLGTTAVRQARFIAMNISGKKEAFPGVLNTSISKVGDLIFGSAGVTEEFAKQKNIKTVNALYKGSSKSEYYPGGKDFIVKLISDDKATIIGCQIIGYEDVAGRLNMISLAIQKNMTLHDLVKTETCYNPCVAPIFDPVIVAAEICFKKFETKYGK